MPIAERGTRLLLDVLHHVHDGLADFALAKAESEDMTAALRSLDRLSDAESAVRVVGHQEVETRESAEDTSGRGIAGGFMGGVPHVSGALGSRDGSTTRTEIVSRAAGTEQHRVHFGEVSSVLGRLPDALGVARIWILLDEWAAIPLDLQPLMADFLRRAVLPVRRVTVKIAAIEQRARFRVDTGDGDHLGLEVGADIAADLDLDDYMVFGNDPAVSKRFFTELLFRHVRSQMLTDGDEPPKDGRDFQRTAFTQSTAVDELVRSAEGVPRDAINVARIAAERAMGEKISVAHVRTAARRWYLNDKEGEVSANPEAARLLHWIIDTVIGKRRARAFLLEQGERSAHPLVSRLYDERVLHAIKRGVSSRDRPGVRYDVFALDYGCYVELAATSRAPQGLYEATADEGGEDEGAWVEVPVDDYRSIRRAILNLDEFERQTDPQLDLDV